MTRVWKYLRLEAPFWACAGIVLACTTSASANPVLPALFSDHMVLQQGKEIPVWGKADPGEQVEVRLADKQANATADPTGKWSTHFPAMTAGGPFILAVRGKKEVVIKDVMIGEVWIASGQSNMTFSLDGTDNGAAEVASANYPQVRFFTVPKK